MFKKKKERDKGRPLKFQLQRRIDIPSYKKYNIPEKFKKISDGKEKHFLGCIYVHPYTHNKRADIAKLIYEKQGFGEFNILAWDMLRRNKKYSRKHECKGYQCPFYQDMSCRRYSTYKTGQGCKANRVYSPNWRVMARVTIYPAETQEGWDYQWNKSKDLMSKRYSWFLKG